MAADAGKLAVAVVIVGVGDIVARCNDHKEKRAESFNTASDLWPLGVMMGGYAIQVFFPRYEEVGEALAWAATPLLVESLARAMDIPKVSAAERATSFTVTMRKAGRLAPP